MSLAVRFLTGLAQAISTMTLYKEGHPSRERAAQRAHEALVRLQEENPTPRFTFMGDEIVLDRRPMRELKSWDWGPRLASVGIQRLECTGPVTYEDFEVFLEDAVGRLSETAAPSAEVRQTRPTNIRYGVVGLKGSDEGSGGRPGDLPTATLAYTLRDEVETVEWMHEELRDRDQLHLLEAETLVRSLTVAMHGDQEFLIPLVQLKRFDQYTTTHALNVAVLSMALAEFVGLSPKEVRAFGISGLLHDLGKVRIPEEILNKPGKLTEAEREVMNSHTVEGARIIMETEKFLDLAAVVAYEHHIRIDGSGYPSLTYQRKCHHASDLVHVCDVFDALRTDRPYRDAWPQEKILNYMEEGAGSEFDGDLARAFVRMMRKWEGRIAEVEHEDAALPIREEEEKAPDVEEKTGDVAAPESDEEGEPGPRGERGEEVAAEIVDAVEQGEDEGDVVRDASEEADANAEELGIVWEESEEADEADDEDEEETEVVSEDPRVE